MSKFAVIENNNVINIIVADSLQDANSLTGANCIEYTDDNPAFMGGTYDPSSKTFISPAPFPSWKFVSGAWQAPVPQPKVDDKQFILWDEEKQSWDIITNS
jgi:hypothetical protein